MFCVAGKSFGSNLKTVVVSGNVHIPFAVTTDLGCAGPSKVAIGSLPDEVLLEIFTFYVEGANYPGWITLVHVCRGWRFIVFASPLRLDLRLHVGSIAHVRELLDIWPALPIEIYPLYYVGPGQETSKVMENVIAALEHRDRVCDITVHYFPVPGQKLERFLEMTQYPFPALTCLRLWKWLDEGEEAPVIPDAFLGGSAPLLQSLRLAHVAFPALPKLLLSANDLVRLDLSHIAHAGYISPEVMVTLLSSMTRLRYFCLTFNSPSSRPSRTSRRPPPMIRTALPALTRFCFRGVSEYVEDLVARIRAPLLHDIHISFFNRLIFDIPQLLQFANRVERSNRLNAAVSFSGYGASVELSSGTDERLLLEISCSQADWQLSSVAQFCGMSLHPIPTSENLKVTINSDNSRHFGRFDIEHSQWEELLYPFINVKNLYLDEDVGLHAAIALQGLVGESLMQMLPALQSLFIKGLQPSGPTWDAAESFVVARHRFGCPITIHSWGEDSEMEYSSHVSVQELDVEWYND